MQAGASIPIYRWRQMRPGHFLGVGGRGMNKKLLKHVFGLYSLPTISSKNCSIAFYPQLTNSICFTNPIYICFHFLVSLFLTASFQSSLKTRIKLHKIAYKMSKNCFRGGVGGDEAWRQRGES